MLYKICAECGKTFYKKINCSIKNWNTKAKYCSIACSKKNTLLDGSRQPLSSQLARGEKNNMWKGGPIWRECIICKKKINLREFTIKARLRIKCCSRKCSNIYRQSDKFRKKQSEIIRNKFPQEFVGIKELRNRLRRNFIYNIWRNKVLRRDNYICQLCGKRGGKLCVDHYPDSYIKIFVQGNIKNYKEARECKKLWRLSAGRTLCLKCHYQTDTFGSKAHNYMH